MGLDSYSRWFIEIAYHKNFHPKQEWLDDYGFQTVEEARGFHDELGCLYGRAQEIEFWKKQVRYGVSSGDIHWTMYATKILSKYIRGIS